MTTDLGARLNLRRRSRRRARLRRAGIIAGVLVVAVALGWLIWFSPVLEVRQVRVEGNELLSAEEITQVAQVPLNTPMARLNGTAIREQVGALRPVAEVRLHRRWPNTLVIEVRERVRVYQRQVNGGYEWVDDTGTAFHTTAEPAAGVVAVIDSEEERLLTDVARVAAVLPPDVVEQTDHVSADSLDHIVIWLADSRQIVWGSAEQSDEKAALLPTLLPMPGTVYNVSVPSHPAVS